MADHNTLSERSYCVICSGRDNPHTVRVVGPFDSQDGAVAWATWMRGENRAWEYKPDVLMPNTRIPAQRRNRQSVSEAAYYDAALNEIADIADELRGYKSIRNTVRPRILIGRIRRLASGELAPREMEVADV